MNMFFSRQRIFALACFLISFFSFSPYLYAVVVSPSDGVNNIMEKIRKCPPGGIIIFSPGIYYGQMRIGEIKGLPNKPVTLRGEPGAILNPQTGSQAPDLKKGSTLQIEKSENIVVEGLEIVGSDRGITFGSCNNITLQGCNIHDTGTGLMLYSCNNATIRKNKISNCAIEHGIYVSSFGVGIHIADNIIINTHVNGIHINGKIQAPLVEHNILYRTGYYPTKEGGAGVTAINGVKDAKIINNLFSDIYGQGVTLISTNATVAYNVFDHFSWSGVLCAQGAQDTFVKGNIFISNKTTIYNVATGSLPSFQSDYNYFVISGQPLLELTDGAETKYSFDKFRSLGQEQHGIKDSYPFIQDSKPRDEMKFYVLSPKSRAIDGGPEAEVDGAIPPGQGSKRADMGLFGGPNNAFTQ